MNIIFEDEDILVVNKPAGITVNRSDTTRHETTLQDWIESKLKINPPAGGEKLKIEQGTDFYNRGGIVHRLDKETSGVIIVAKNPSSFTQLQKQFKERTVKKVYTALVHGRVEPEDGEIRVPVGRLPWNRKRFGVLAGGREAVTKYRILRYYDIRILREPEIVTLMELYPQTGRTHQIRVHLKHIGHPIFADELYAGRKTARADRKVLPRVFLHASKITFQHPRSKKLLTFESPLPEELQSFLKTLS